MSNLLNFHLTLCDFHQISRQMLIIVTHLNRWSDILHSTEENNVIVEPLCEKGNKQFYPKLNLSISLRYKFILIKTKKKKKRSLQISHVKRGYSARMDTSDQIFQIVFWISEVIAETEITTFDDVVIIWRTPFDGTPIWISALITTKQRTIVQFTKIEETNKYECKSVWWIKRREKQKIKYLMCWRQIISIWYFSIYVDVDISL